MIDNSGDAAADEVNNQNFANNTQRNFNVKGFEPPLRRKNSIGNLLKKAQDLYQGQDVMMIN
jgi:hypothetical protein